MASLAQINDTQVSIINFKSVPVITTAMLADFYGTDVNNIQQNYIRNTDRFVQGKHFFKLEGTELKEFKQLTDSKTVSRNSRNLTLWTERGAARHAKMLDTDQAWEVFEQLEDCYFVRKEILAKTHKSERTALHEAHALLVTKTKHLNVSDAWKMIKQRFNANHIDEIPYDQIPVAVEYVHHLIALYSNPQHQKFDADTYELIKNLVETILTQNFVTRHLYCVAYTFDNHEGMKLAKYAYQTNIAALKLTRKMNMRGIHNEPIISNDLRVISSSKGQYFNNVWFHPLSEAGTLAGPLQISGGLR